MFNAIKILSKEERLKLNDDEMLQMGVQLLKDKGIAREKLYDAIKASISEYGPYFVFDNGVSVAHAPQGNHSLSVGASLIVSKEPKDFFGKKVQIFITLAVPENGDHMALLQKVITIVKDEQQKQKILNYTIQDEK